MHSNLLTILLLAAGQAVVAVPVAPAALDIEARALKLNTPGPLQGGPQRRQKQVSTIVTNPSGPITNRQDRPLNPKDVFTIGSRQNFQQDVFAQGKKTNPKAQEPSKREAADIEAREPHILEPLPDAAPERRQNFNGIPMGDIPGVNQRRQNKNGIPMGQIPNINTRKENGEGGVERRQGHFLDVSFVDVNQRRQNKNGIPMGQIPNINTRKEGAESSVEHR